MRRPSIPLAAAFLLVPGLASGQEAAGVGRVAWLQGCWEAVSPRRTIEEHWMAPRGGTMLGMSRTVRGDRLAEYELLMLVERDGQLVLRAHPSNQPAADFPLKELGDSTVVFEDPAHDFPQRIGYRRGADSLLAWIEGTANGQDRRIEFPFRRAACPDR